MASRAAQCQSNPDTGGQRPPRDENQDEFSGQFKQRKRRRQALERAAENPGDHPAAEVVSMQSEDIRYRAGTSGQPTILPSVGLERSKAKLDKSGKTPKTPMENTFGHKSKLSQDCERPPDSGQRQIIAAEVKEDESGSATSN